VYAEAVVAPQSQTGTVWKNVGTLMFSPFGLPPPFGAAATLYMAVLISVAPLSTGQALARLVDPLGVPVPGYSFTSPATAPPDLLTFFDVVSDLQFYYTVQIAGSDETTTAILASCSGWWET